jgi:hypothetical protein
MMDDKIAVVAAITLICCFAIVMSPVDIAGMVSNAICALGGLATGTALAGGK